MGDWVGKHMGEWLASPLFKRHCSFNSALLKHVFLLFPPKFQNQHNPNKD